MLFGAPLGLSGVVSGFAPDGMTFEDCFHLHEGQSSFEVMMRFYIGIGIGIGLPGRHWTCRDSSHVAPSEQTGPSSAALRSGNRSPMQRLKLWLAARRFGPLKDEFNREGYQRMSQGPASGSAPR